MNLKILFLVLVLFSSIVYADTASCSADSFRQACAACTFDANGKMNQQCWQSYQKKGTDCVAKEYPITATLYSQGDCSEIDKCAAQLKACTSKASTGSDKQDCSTRGVKDCYWRADQCVKKAENKCNPMDISCPFAIMMILMLSVGMVKYSIQKKEK